MFSKLFEGRHRGHGCREEGHHRHGHRDMRRGGRHHFGDRDERGEGRRGGRGEGRHGERVQRLFEHGDLRRVLLALVAKKPSHGYELIKAIEEASSGLYVPSPGVIYPTLTLLEEQDFLEAVATGNGRKSYQITEAGKIELAQHQEVVDIIFARLAGATRPRGGNLAEGISDAMHRLKRVLRGNMMRGDLSAEQVARVNATLVKAVESIEAEFAAIDAELAAASSKNANSEEKK
ncbi:MAG: PadR family transcriptional regulator [Ewingella americana]|uniref:PadR family transcriptional regulator n=1 Tax=Ewingella americana TaxID=41202 RepID=UPI00242F1896|nr:PadR family transcriptional regulator [Ewingella americana]MCI1676853.1 PadR family transcriptional regulator [Ewingella americana]MCI1853557.1 PadR family transcriptional regulator [Ewingella americana]MCI1860202.1 PadR family transcriptional regulator [Ewingella americana]MCI2164463.1 PadR family transcriptional regulator [Ewingella americana]MCI2211977.1 PadR family transcriptional regulator [Ewingella americana]